MRARGGELQVESTSGHSGLRKRPLFFFPKPGFQRGWWWWWWVGGLIVEKHSV